jgi:peroxiredoxin
MSDILRPGSKAPDFTLKVTPDQNLSLSEFAGRRGHPRLLPGGLESGLRRPNGALQPDPARIPRARRRAPRHSVDGAWCHSAYARDRNLHFALLSDFEPKGAVSKSYGAYRDGEGTSERALFVLDEKGVVAWSYLSPVAINPGADGILDALDKMSQPENSHVDSESAGIAT